MKANIYIIKHTMRKRSSLIPKLTRGKEYRYFVVGKSSDAAITRLPGRRIGIEAERSNGKKRGGKRRILCIFCFLLFHIQLILNRRDGLLKSSNREERTKRESLAAACSLKNYKISISSPQECRC